MPDIDLAVFKKERAEYDLRLVPVPYVRNGNTVTVSDSALATMRAAPSIETALKGSQIWNFLTQAERDSIADPTTFIVSTVSDSASSNTTIDTATASAGYLASL